MNAIEQKLLNKYQQFVDEKGTRTPIAVNVLVRYANGVISEDCIFITKDGKPCMYGTQAVAHVNEIIACLANIDFLPEYYEFRSQYEDEVMKFAESKEDKEYYFRNHRFGFSVLDILDFVQLPAVDDLCIIGHSEIVAGGVRYYGENTGYGDIYLNQQNIAKREGICYISEAAFEDDTNEGEDFILLTPDNTFHLIEMGGVVTYDSARLQVMEHVFGFFPAFRKYAPFNLVEKFIYHVTDAIFGELGGCLGQLEGYCYSTYLEQLDMCEELRIFLEDEFVEFMAKKLGKSKKDNEFRESLFDVLGENCYANKNFIPTKWDKLVVKYQKNK